MNRSIITRLLGCWLLCGCATTSAQTIETPVGTVETQLLQSLRGIPVTATEVPLPTKGIFGFYDDLQVASGAVWATKTNKKTLRIDAWSFDVDEVSWPRGVGGANQLLVDERSLWLSTTMAAKGRMGARGDLYRVALDTDQVTATITRVGVPFASGDGAVWAYNRHTQTVSGIDTKDHRLRTQLVTRAGLASDQTHFTYGASAIWQFAYAGDVSLWKLAAGNYYGGTFPDGVVRRIDPASGKVLAEVAIGPYQPTTQIRFLAGDIWVLGVRDNGGILRDGGGLAFATRIDATTNQVSAVIPFSVPSCSAPFLRSPVIWNGGIWVSTGCYADNGPMLGWGTDLRRIDVKTNSINDGIPWSAGGRGIPLLATGEGGLWALAEGLLVRFEF